MYQSRKFNKNNKMSAENINETSGIEVRLNNEKLFIISIYRPSRGEKKKFFKVLDLLLNTVCLIQSVKNRLLVPKY